TVRLDEWVVMPNHVHGIIVIEERKDNRGDFNDRRGVQPQRGAAQLNAPTVIDQRETDNAFSGMSPRRHTLTVIVRTYKAAVTTACREAQLDFGWQRGYYEHVVRGEADLGRIRQYIQTNPARWVIDILNPTVQGQRTGRA